MKVEESKPAVASFLGGVGLLSLARYRDLTRAPNMNFQRPSPQFYSHYENVTLLGPPTMRGAIVFAGSSHPRLVEGICDRLGTKPGHATLGKFKNGETSVTIRMFSGPLVAGGL